MPLQRRTLTPPHPHERAACDDLRANKPQSGGRVGGWLKLSTTLAYVGLLAATAFVLYAMRTVISAESVGITGTSSLLPDRMTRMGVLKQQPPERERTSVGFKRLEKDGFGSQFQFQLMGYLWARLQNKCFCKIPMDSIEHTAGKSQVTEFPTTETEKEMDAFAGLRSDACCELANADVVLEYSRSPFDFWYFTYEDFLNHPQMTANLTFNLDYMKYMLTPEIAQEMRRMYFSTPKPRIPEPCHVAFHVRKGDTTPEWQEKEKEKAEKHGYSFTEADAEFGMFKFTPDEEARRIVSHMRTRFPKERICVFSQGKPADFAFLKPYGVDLRLNGEIREAFHHMVLAPHLVVARQSSMSNAAGILNTGQVYHYCKAEFSEDGRIPLRPCPCIQGDERSMGLSHRLGRVGQGASHRQNFMCFGGDGWGSSSILNLMHWIPLVGERLE